MQGSQRPCVPDKASLLSPGFGAWGSPCIRWIRFPPHFWDLVIKPVSIKKT